ncbi:recombinase family protein [Arthrobacter sp. IA7]|uniref:recombinase family protein n=1 Tax=Arthrobacter ipis TaxID=2716202 RepID=UPI0016820674|nr:recombinase family protein [Arthrobacter ipis]
MSTVSGFRSKGIRLHSIVYRLDPSSPQGKLQLTLLASMAEYERAHQYAGLGRADRPAENAMTFGPAPLEDAVAREAMSCC